MNLGQRAGFNKRMERFEELGLRKWVFRPGIRVFRPGVLGQGLETRSIELSPGHSSLGTLASPLYQWLWAQALRLGTLIKCF